MRTCKLTPKQHEATALLAGPQRHTLLVGGSRSGKSFALVRAVVVRACKAAGSRHAIMRFRYNAVRQSVWLDTLPKVVGLCFPQLRTEEHRQDGFVALPNGSEIWFGGLDEKERVEKILGQEYATIFFNECSQIPYSSVLTAQTRLAQNVKGLKNRAYYDLNPTGLNHWTRQLFVEHRDPISRASLSNPDDYAWMQLNPGDNIKNLDPAYLETLRSLPSRQRRRFLDGEYQAEVEHALWPTGLIDLHRVATQDVPNLARVVIGVDPSGASGADGEAADEIGIIAMGRGVDGHGYPLEDASGAMSPEKWAAAAVDLYRRRKGDVIVAEKNFGGEMVRTVIRTADPNVPVKLVNASRGKVVRAEPVASLYEQGKIHHVGTFPQLEDQLEAFSTTGYTGSGSPDRADALVWAASELMVEEQSFFRLRSLN